MDEQSEREYKDQLYEQFARICKALASARRLELLELLVQGEYSVEELARESDMSVANTSQHLQNLRAARLVDVQREGVKVRYRLAGRNFFPVLAAIRELAESRLAEIDRITERFFERREQWGQVAFAELALLLEKGQICLLDVRPEVEYASARIAGALNIPLKSLPERLMELPRNKEIVVYCRGPYSVLADRAVSLLLENSYEARRLENGLPEWRAQGLPVEREPRVREVAEALA